MLEMISMDTHNLVLWQHTGTSPRNDPGSWAPRLLSIILYSLRLGFRVEGSGFRVEGLGFRV